MRGGWSCLTPVLASGRRPAGPTTASLMLRSSADSSAVPPRELKSFTVRQRGQLFVVFLLRSASESTKVLKKLYKHTHNV